MLAWYKQLITLKHYDYFEALWTYVLIPTLISKILRAMVETMMSYIIKVFSLSIADIVLEDFKRFSFRAIKCVTRLKTK